MAHLIDTPHVLSQPLSRRTMVLGAAGGLGLAAAAPTAASAKVRARTVPNRARRRPRPRPEQPSVGATGAAASMVAVRVFPSYSTKVYAHHDAVLARLGELGIKRISHKLTPAVASNKAVIAFTQRAYTQYGIKSWLTMGEPHVTLSPADWDKMEATLRGPLAGMVDRVYGWNEPNHIRSGGPLPSNWHETTAAHQRQLWARVSPLGIKVGTPSLWSGDFAKHDADLAKLAPGLRGSFDHIGWHLYPRGGVGEDLLDRFDATYRKQMGTFPVVCTEAGHFTAPKYVGGAVNITQDQQAFCVPKMVDAYLARGYGLSFFELLDDPDPSGANREAHLGLINTPAMDPTTWTPKPAFDSLKARLAQPVRRRRTN